METLRHVSSVHGVFLHERQAKNGCKVGILVNPHFRIFHKGQLVTSCATTQEYVIDYLFEICLLIGYYNWISPLFCENKMNHTELFLSLICVEA